MTCPTHVGFFWATKNRKQRVRAPSHAHARVAGTQREKTRFCKDSLYETDKNTLLSPVWHTHTMSTLGGKWDAGKTRR